MSNNTPSFLSEKKSHYDVVVLGAGAAGLFCALTAAQRGRRVLVLEKSNKVGKKILMSGGGRCNFTNYFVTAENYISHNPHFCKSALNQFTQWDFITLVEKHGIAYEERKHGQLFCIQSSKDILKLLLDECDQNAVEIVTDIEVNAVEKTEKTGNENARYSVKCAHKNRIKTIDCESLVVATGALSIPTLGGSGFGYDLASQFNLNLLERRAGLVPFIFTDDLKLFCETLSGVSVEVEIFAQSKSAPSFRENILFTHRGLSGPAVLQISNYWYQGESIHINFFPDTDVANIFNEAKNKNPKHTLMQLLSPHLGKSLTKMLLQRLLPNEYGKPIGELSDKRLLELAKQLQEWIIKPSNTEGYRTAEVTLGGVDTACLSSKTMEVKGQAGLYFIGEVVDVTEHLGGFNFQWAWSSGYAAGMRA